MTPAFGVMLAYLGVQLGIGVWISRRIRNESDYLLAGRNLGYSLATFSIFATWFGAETLVGSAGNAYRDGVSLGNAEPFGYGLCLILAGLVFAGPLWRRRLTTLADLFRQRYSVGVERLVALIVIPGSVLWAAAQIRAFGYILTTSSTISPSVAIACAAGFTMLYTMFGGLLADATNDVIQSVVITVGLFILLGGVVIELQQSGRFAETLGAVGPVSILPATGASAWAIAEEWAIPICGSVIAAELVGRLIATRTPKIASRSSLVAGVLYIMVGTIPLVIGLLGQRIVPSLSEAEQVIPAVAHALLPTFFFAIFAGSVVAAILSTVDSTLLIASGLMSHNILIPVFRITNERTKVMIARGGVLAFGAIAYIQAVRAEGVFELVESASAFGSAGILVTAVFGLFTPMGGRLAAMSTLLFGLFVYLAATFSGFAYPYLLSIAASLLTYVIVSVMERVAERMRLA
ncbi:MAG TPA: sodium:solute symporter family protein [Gemmatimonadaceae bacterium]|nr:sodium:solute symporter family protein [Gemmatimonadaceae bacterium]